MTSQIKGPSQNFGPAHSRGSSFVPLPERLGYILVNVLVSNRVSNSIHAEDKIF